MLSHRPHERTLAAIRRWDPLAWILLSHGVAMSLAGEPASPLLVSTWSVALAVSRLALGWWGRRAVTRIQFARSLVAVVPASAALVVGGGVASPCPLSVRLRLGAPARA